MKNTMINVLVFATGAAIGSLVTWKVLKTKYDRLVQEEIDSVKETWARLSQENDISDEFNMGDDAEEETNEGQSQEDGRKPTPMTDYAVLTNKYKHPSDSGTNEEGGGDDPIADAINGPYVIDPEECGNGNFDHDVYCLTYYADHILADDWFNTLNIEETIGLEALDHFGDYAEDVVHVRNERLKADYEVVSDSRRYMELVAEHPLVRMHAN